MKNSIVHKYVKDIKAYFQNQHGIDYVIIFGSAVKNLRPDSDVDLLVGGRLNFQQKTNAALSLEQQCGRKIDIVCIDEAGHALALEAFAKGISVLLNDSERLKRDYLRKFYEHEDNIPLHRIRAEKVKREFMRG